MADGAAPTGGSELELPKILPLHLLCDQPRFQALDRLDAYAKATQYNWCKYTWDGQVFTGDALYDPPMVPPLRLRKPDARFDLPKLITRSLTALVLGEERWPEVNFPGDAEAEDYTKQLAKISKLETRFQEIRNLGGACGTAVISFAFVDGKLRTKAHRAKHVHVQRWKDRDDHIIASALKAYAHKRIEFTQEGKPIERTYYYAHYWDERCEVIWDPIPEHLAKEGLWANKVPRYRADHNFGEAPIYWAQNLADSENIDGVSDFDGLTDLFDSINRLISATLKGTIANVDPTLVIKDDWSNNPGSIRKGSENAIWSKGGAEYLEIKGDAVKAAFELIDKLVRYSLDVSGVVLGDPNEIAAKVTSAAALKVIYLPMLNQASLLRTQYGDLLERVLLGELRAARKLRGTAGPILETSDGRRIQETPLIIMPPRVEVPTKRNPETQTTEKATDEPKLVERTPGTSEAIAVEWPPYFMPTAADLNQTVEALTKAKGQIISDRTAVRAAAPFFDVTDVDQELMEISVDNQARSLLEQQTNGTGEFAPDPPPAKK